MAQATFDIQHTAPSIEQLSVESLEAALDATTLSESVNTRDSPVESATRTEVEGSSNSPESVRTPGGPEVEPVAKVNILAEPLMTVRMSKKRVFNFFKDRIGDNEYIRKIYRGQKVIAMGKANKGGQLSSGIVFSTSYVVKMQADVAILEMAYTTEEARSCGLMTDLFEHIICTGALGPDVKALVCQPMSDAAEEYWKRRGFVTVLKGGWNYGRKWSDGAVETLQAANLTMNICLKLAFNKFFQNKHLPIMAFVSTSAS